MGDPGDRIPDQITGGGEIHPNMGAEALPAEPVSVVEGEAAGVLHELLHFFCFQIGAEIDPHQIGALQRRNVQQRKLLEQALTGIAVIFQDDPAYLPEPGLTPAIRTLCGDVTEGISTLDADAGGEAVIAFPEACIRNDNEGILAAGEIEGLGRGGQGDQKLVTG